MKYNGTIYRPPLEANTLLLPVTEGCSHNKCAFCNMYRGVPFRMTPLEDIEEYLTDLRRYYGDECDRIDRIYLVGAEPFALSARRLLERIEIIHRHLPGIREITMYARVDNISTKSDEELAELHAAGVSDLYLGVECGLERALAFMNKGHTAEDTRRECARLARAGIRHNDLLMVGTAGAGCGSECAEATARLLNETRPDKILITFLTAFAGTELDKAIQRGEFKMASDREMLQEERELLARLDLPQTYFWAAHSLNSVSVQDFIGSGRDRMLGILDRGIEKMADRPSMRISLTGSL